MSDQLAEENRQLRAQLAALLQQATRNQQIWQRHQDFDLKLIAAPGLRELFDHLFNTLSSTASIEVITLALLDPEYEIRRVMSELEIRQVDYPQLLFLHEFRELGPLRRRTAPLLAPYSEEQHGAFFPDPIPAPASIVLMPLCRNERVIGCLNFGSKDGDRFRSGMSADFLAHMASVVAVCLENVINNERLQHMGLTDALTGVHNRRYVEGRLHEEIERARRHATPLSCLYIDIDHFKQINDRIGHRAGDKVLREVAARIKAELRLSDTVGRFGGEEFVVLLSDTAADDALNVAERIRTSVGEQELVMDDAARIAVSVSVGVASAAAMVSNTVGMAATKLAERLLAQADCALYRAKEGGRNQVVLGV